MTLPPSSARTGEPAAVSPLVLIVDDNETNRKLARDVLRAAGLRTIETASGWETLALAAGRRPDVILLDLRLPDMDGMEVARRLQDGADTACIPVVALERPARFRRRRFAADGGLRRLPREADRRRRVSGTGAQLLPARHLPSDRVGARRPPTGVPAPPRTARRHGWRGRARRPSFQEGLDAIRAICEDRHAPVVRAGRTEGG